MALKVGDKVKVIANKKQLEAVHISPSDEIVGAVGVVGYVDPPVCGVDLRGEKDKRVWLYEQYLELVESVKQPEPEPEPEPKPEPIQKRFGHPKFYEMLEAMADLHSRKNHDYAGNSDPLKNLKASLRMGVSPFQGVMIRLQDKWSRLEQFVTSGELMVKNESVVDTLMDNAVYSILAIILYQEEQEKTNETK